MCLPDTSKISECLFLCTHSVNNSLTVERSEPDLTLTAEGVDTFKARLDSRFHGFRQFGATVFGEVPVERSRDTNNYTAGANSYNQFATVPLYQSSATKYHDKTPKSRFDADFAESDFRELLRAILNKRLSIDDSINEILNLLTTAIELLGDDETPLMDGQLLPNYTSKATKLNRFLRVDTKCHITSTTRDSDFHSQPELSFVETSPFYEPSPIDSVGDSNFLSHHTETADHYASQENPKSDTQPEGENGGGGTKPSIETYSQQEAPELDQDSPKDHSNTPEEHGLDSAASTPYISESPESNESFTSDDIADYHPTSLILGDRAHVLWAQAVRFFDHLLQSRLGYSKSGTQCARETECGALSLASSYGGEKSNIGERGDKRRQLSDNQSDDLAGASGDGNGDGQGPGGPRSKRQKHDKLLRRKIACPYMKKDPIHFSTWRTCVGPGFEGINRLKYA